MSNFDDLIGEKAKNQDKKPKNYVAIVLDQSGSMESIRSAAISFFNEQLDVIKENAEKQDMFVTLVKFNHEIDPVLINKRADEVKKLTMDTYIPGGMTALYDAIGKAISLIQGNDNEDENVSFLVVTISDGEENASKEFRTGIADLVKKLQDKGNWTFVYLGANVDLKNISNTTGISMVNTMSYVPTMDGLNIAAYNTVISSQGYFDNRSAGYSNVYNFYDSKTPINPPPDMVDILCDCSKCKICTDSDEEKKK